MCDTMQGRFSHLAWRNIWRNKRRTLLTSLAIAFGVMFLVFIQSYIKGVSESFLENMVRSETGHIRIAKQEYLRLERILPKEQLIFDYTEIEDKIQNIPKIDTLTERIKFFLVLSHGEKSQPCVAVGINPEKEKNFLGLENYIVEGEYLDSSSASEMLLGKKLADELGVSIGNEMFVATTDINYSLYALTFKVKGIFQTGFDKIDKSLFYIPLKRAQTLLDCPGAVHEILLLLKDPDAAVKTACIIMEKLEEEGLSGITAVPWKTHYFVKFLSFAKSIRILLLFIVFLIVALVILNTMIMSVLERIHEIGIMKSFGMKEREITFLFLAESFYIGLIGSLAGGGIGAVVSVITQKTGLDFSAAFDKIKVPLPFVSSVYYPDFTLYFLINSIVFGVVIALIAALYPAVKGSKMSPVQALRSGLN